MSSYYQTLKDAELLLKKFGAPNKPAGGKYDMCPRYPALSSGGRWSRTPAMKQCRSAKRSWVGGG
ncbi:hypothetical protein ACFWXM_01175 [Achromobacter xylosoxidans]|uniref:hypothetical protein n=1 Tax=Alcaligenes xylosoxydans xylosoxydans TaxID=85698 RepID=UPI001EEF6700|nr:hypothetical protein [Achromobacter xylosoxidans]